MKNFLLLVPNRKNLGQQSQLKRYKIFVNTVNHFSLKCFLQNWFYALKCSYTFCNLNNDVSLKHETFNRLALLYIHKCLCNNNKPRVI